MKKLLVSMPTKKVYKQKRYKDKVYVYFITRAYRNEKGNPTSDAVMIGMEDVDTGMLIPNHNFFEIYDCDITIKVNGLKEKK